MPTPGYAIKHWWRNCRKEGESLKQFARRNDSPTYPTTTAAVWLRNKRRRSSKH